MNQALLAEIGHEYGNTRKLLERVPFEQYNWKPHEKSTSLGKLATHIAAIPQLATSTLTTDELDLTNGAYPPETFTSTAEMVEAFNRHAAKAKEALANTTDEDFAKPYSLIKNGQVLFTLPKAGILRSFAISHIIHHRAQLQVYLRMLGVPVPGFYGPSADDLGL